MSGRSQVGPGSVDMAGVHNGSLARNCIPVAFSV
jgi:hypothetical protein